MGLLLRSFSSPLHCIGSNLQKLGNIKVKRPDPRQVALPYKIHGRSSPHWGERLGKKKNRRTIGKRKKNIEKQFLCCCVGKRLMQKRTYPAGQIDAVKHLQLSGVRVACASSYYHIHHCNMGWYHNILKVSSEASKAFNIVTSISHMLMAILIPG